MSNPGNYGSAIKAVKDLLNKGYDVETRKLQVKTKTADGVAVTFDGEMQSFGANAVLGSLSFKHSTSAFNLDKFAVSSHGRFNLETSSTQLVDNMKISLKAEDGLAANRLPVKGGNAQAYKAAANVEAEYKSDGCTVNAAVDLVGGPSVTISSLGAVEKYILGFTVGVDTGLDEGTGFAVKDYGGCVGYKGSDFTAVVQSAKKCSEFSANIHQKVNADTCFAAQAVYKAAKKSTAMTVGGSYKVDSNTLLQAKLNHSADLTASMKQNMGAVSMTVAGTVNAITMADPKFGMNFVLNL